MTSARVSWSVGLLVGFVTISTGAYAESRKVVAESTSQPAGGISRTELTIRAGSSFDQFDVVRLTRAGAVGVGDTPVILLAPFGFPAEFWEAAAPGSAYEDSFGPALALEGYDVWLVDSRLAAAAPGQCESGAVDCSPMQDWGVDTAVEDALFVAKLAKKAGTSGKKPIIGGLSGGSSTALAAVNGHPNRFRGLFLWEGTLYTADPAIRSRNAAFCLADRAAFDQGVFFDGSVAVFQLLFQLATIAPNDPSPIPIFPPGTTNLQAILFALTLPNPSNPLNFTETFIRLVGDPFAATLVHSDIDRVLAWGGLVGTYAPIAFIRDSHCAMGGLDDSFTDRLDKFDGSALVFAEGLGFGQMMLDTAALLERADVTIDYNPTFGESDRYSHVDWQGEALVPLVSWLETVD